MSEVITNEEMAQRNCVTCVRHAARFPNNDCIECIETSKAENKFPRHQKRPSSGLASDSIISVCSNCENG